MDLPTYTNIWRIEKRLYKLYDLRLPMPLPLVQVGVFIGVSVPWVVLLQIIGVPFHGGWALPLYVVPPFLVTWLATRPVIESKRLTELLISQFRYVTEPRTWARMTPIGEPAEVAIVGKVWRHTACPPAAKAPARDRQAAKRPAPPARVPRTAPRPPLPAVRRPMPPQPQVLRPDQPAEAPLAPVQKLVVPAPGPSAGTAHGAAGSRPPGQVPPAKRTQQAPAAAAGAPPAAPAAGFGAVADRVAGKPRELGEQGASAGSRGPRRPLRPKRTRTSAHEEPGTPPAPRGRVPRPRRAQATGLPDTGRPTSAEEATRQEASPASRQDREARQEQAAGASPPVAPTTPAAPWSVPAIPGRHARAGAEVPVDGGAPADGPADREAQPVAPADEGALTAQSEPAAADTGTPPVDAQGPAEPDEGEPASGDHVPKHAARRPPVDPRSGFPVPLPPPPLPVETPPLTGPAAPVVPPRPPLAPLDVPPMPGGRPTWSPPSEPVPVPPDPARSRRVPAARGGEPRPGNAPVAGGPIPSRDVRSGPASPVRPMPTPTLAEPASDDGPVAHGLRRLLATVGAGVGATQDGDYEERVRASFDGARRVVVLGCTGGAGQTVTSLMLGHTFAQHRGGRVVAVDVNPGPGALARRARNETRESLTSLIAHSQNVVGYTMMRRFTSASKSGLEVVSAGKNPVQALDDRDYMTALATLDRFYSVTVLDAAAAVVARVLPYADQIVLVAPANSDAPRAVAMTFEWLDGHGHDDLRARAVTVINGVSRRSMDDVEEAEAVARGRCRALVRIPWDDHLSLDRSPRNELRTLRAPTRKAYVALAGVVTGGLVAVPERYRHQEVAQ